jgi:hypothetical protein
MELYNPNLKLFAEMEGFLRYYFAETSFPISIQRPGFSKPQILFNTEQLTRPDVVDFYKNQKDNPIIYEIWDYSKSNIFLLNQLGITNTKFIPLKIWPSYQKQLVSYNSTNTYNFDIGFVGWVHGEKRTNILQKIIDSGISIDIIQDLYGEQRDQRLAKCRMILNIHFNENYKIFEQYRCFAWLDIGKEVLSENSLDNDPRCINVSYNEIVPTLMKVLNK